MITEHDLDGPGSDDAAPPRSLFLELVSVRMLNMIALCTAVLWVVGSVGAVTSLARSGDHATWEYVDAAAAAGEYLIVTVIAMSAAALLDAAQRAR